MKNLKNELLNLSVYKSYSILAIYLIFSILKIYGQYLEDYLIQTIFLFLSNLLLVLPFIKNNQPGYDKKILFFFTFLFLGQSIIIFYNKPEFLKLGMVFYILSKIIILLILDHQHKEIGFKTRQDYWKILGPQVASFGLAYLLYNDSKLDSFTSILVILYSQLGALLLTYILYLNNLRNQLYIKLGLILLLFHDSIGGFNFFHHKFDTYFILTYSLIIAGNYLLGLGLWSSRKELYKNHETNSSVNWFLSVEFAKKSFLESVIYGKKKRSVFSIDKPDSKKDNYREKCPESIFNYL